MKNKVLYIVIAILLVIGVGVGTWVILNPQDAEVETTQQNTNVTVTPTDTTQDDSTPEAITAEEVTYQGEDGQTALALLQQQAEVDMDGEGEMAFVTSINGYKAKENEFWAFYVNGESKPA